MAREKGRKYVWTHGVITQVEFSELVESIRHWGGGTEVRQNPQTFNWFHLAIPTEIYFWTHHWWGWGDDAHHILEEMYITAELNDNAIIRQVQLWQGNYRVADFGGLDVRGPSVDETYDIEDMRLNGGITASVQVEFRGIDPLGQVNFTGAGVKLYKD